MQRYALPKLYSAVKIIPQKTPHRRLAVDANKRLILLKVSLIKNALSLLQKFTSRVDGFAFVHFNLKV